METSDFTTMVGQTSSSLEDQVRYAARIAVYDDMAAVPRVVVIEPTHISAYLDQITQTVYKLAHELGGALPFAIIREIVENYIHAAFIEPSISIFDGGNTIRFCDQGPGISNKERALEIGTTSASDEMKRYIRGVGSGLPIVLQYMSDKGGSLSIEDNIGAGCVVTISTHKSVSQTPPEDDVAIKAQTGAALRKAKVLQYLLQNEFVGVKELVKAYGESQATWSRVLMSLDDEGLTKKAGQKRILTDAGRVFLSSKE